MKKIALILTLSLLPVLAQSNADMLAGNSMKLAWDQNATSEGVTNYSVYVSGVKILNTPTNIVSFNSFLFTNGTYQINVSASNINGESALSTNLIVRYWANKPLPPAGLTTK